MALTILLAFAPGARPHFGQSAKGDVTIAKIVVRGNTTLTGDAIIRTSGLRVGNLLTARSLADAEKKLLVTGDFGMHLRNPNEGIKVRSRISGRRAAIEIEVDENDPIKEIKLTDTGPLKVSDLTGLMQTKAGGLLNLPRLQRDVERLQKAYDEEGYQSFVSEKLGVRDRVLYIPIVVTRVARITFKGLSRVKESTVFENMKVKAGDYYNLTNLLQDSKTLRNLGLFDDIGTAFAYPTPGKIELTLKFKEKPRP